MPHTYMDSCIYYKRSKLFEDKFQQSTYVHITEFVFTTSALSIIIMLRYIQLSWVVVKYQSAQVVELATTN